MEITSAGFRRTCTGRTSNRRGRLSPLLPSGPDDILLPVYVGRPRSMPPPLDIDSVVLRAVNRSNRDRRQVRHPRQTTMAGGYRPENRSTVENAEPTEEKVFGE
ncbi:hypothetical protein [Haladaptatus sp. NG-SE-30]